MSFQRTKPEELLELPTDWRVTLSVASARLVVFVPIWSFALWQFDDPRIETNDPFVFNLRLAFLFYLIETLVSIYRTRYVPALAPRQAWHRAAKDAAAAAGTAFVATPISCIVRWGIVAGFTALLIKIPSPTSWTTVVAAIVPTIVVAAFTRVRSKSSEDGMPKGTVRGTHIGSYAEAVARAASLRRQVER
jgi:hypothetical protein